ncbi:MAG: hypothetical protein C0616_06490 [Desulfuromonas sp.]|nr:MAG: hypothetical protein C0616_06490 [Desulfuromonas sp.]
MTNRTRILQFILLLFALGWSILIAWLSLVENPPHPPGLLGWDKLNHFLAYGLLSSLLYLGLGLWWHDWRRLLLALISSFCYGAMMEVFQSVFSHGRSAEWGDLVADFCGILLGAFVARLLISKVHHAG